MAKFALESEHRDFYRKHQFIEFDGFLSGEQLQQLNGAIDSTLARRLGVLNRQLPTQPPAALYQAGRDLWRSSETVRKIVVQESWALIALELTETKSLRLGCDQLFSSVASTMHEDASDSYKQLFSKVQTLEDIICFQGVIGGLMVCLAGPGGEALGPFAQQPGNAIFFSSKTPLDLSKLQPNSGKHLLIVYTQPTTVYVAKLTDPNAHLLKQWGYALGDKLSDKLNPILLR